MNLPKPYSEFVERTLEPTELPARDGFPDAWHLWSDEERRAVVQSWASGRPLLVRGEAGCGKSQLARALAAVLVVPLEPVIIHPRFEASDLMYVEDHAERLAHAQLLATIRPELTAKDALAWLKEQLDRSNYVTHGVLWKAMEVDIPPLKKDEPLWPRAVVLIDEIDKADSDVPNALLGALGNRSFSVPGRDTPVSCDTHMPLCVLTTNEDRELPAAFVRRCTVLNIRPDLSDEASFLDWLKTRANAHRQLAVLQGSKPCIFEWAAQQVCADRKVAHDEGLPTVGLAEYLDLLYAIAKLAGGDHERGKELLRDLSPFALVKQRELKQSRNLVEPKPGA